MQIITNKFIKGYDKNDTYYEYYGDVANLDSDDDLEPCESLPGGP